VRTSATERPGGSQTKFDREMQTDIASASGEAKRSAAGSAERQARDFARDLSNPISSLSKSVVMTGK
jgi:hypothetical protein